MNRHDEIKTRFEVNLSRVESIIDTYEVLIDQGSADHSDLLRAGVVFLHTSLEDLLRSLAEWKLPSADSRFLSNIPLINLSRGQKFDLGELAKHRGKTVDQLIQESVDGHLARVSYNNYDEVASLLETLGLNAKNSFGPHAKDLTSLMARRHMIVHRADRHVPLGTAENNIKSIELENVQQWLDDVRRFSLSILQRIMELE